MTGEPVVTVVGALGQDPELRFVASGHAVCTFTVASTPRTRKGEQWVDGETLWLRCTAWRGMAENVAESLHKGDRVIVQGRLVQRTWETKDGEKRTVFEMQVDEVGPSLLFASARVQRTARGERQDTQVDPWAPDATASADDAPPF